MNKENRGWLKEVLNKASEDVKTWPQWLKNEHTEPVKATDSSNTSSSRSADEEGKARRVATA
jgi:hypothetical protein